MHAKILRVASSDACTLGVFFINGWPFCVTGELPWRNNRRNASCIPCGLYDCQRITSEKFGPTFHIQDVEDRSEIIFHAGNVPKEDSRGCVLLGNHYGDLGGEPAVLASKQAFNKFLLKTQGVDNFSLIIEDVCEELL